VTELVSDTELISVVVADDHPAVRAGVRALLELGPDIEVVAEASTTAEVIAAAARFQPDVVMMDLRMPEAGGVEATRAIVGESPHIAVVMLSMVEDSDSIFAALRAGAHGYLLKESTAEELRRAVHAAAGGGFITSRSVARRISEFFSATDLTRSSGPFPALTDREREILDLIAEGRNNAYITRHLVLSPKTVRNHISNVFAKLHVADRADAIVRAREAGMGQRSTASRVNQGMDR
jgi:DNA-binding NarL/FixJ family response regulator